MDHEFTLIVAGDLTDDDVIDQLFEAGCDDASVGVVDGVGVISFLRDEMRFSDAVLSAIREVESVPGLLVRRVEPDDLVTMTEIADRLGRSRESVRLLIAGERGDGSFPPPVSHARTRMRLWRWSEVARWANASTVDEHEQAMFVAILNSLLETRWLASSADGDKMALQVTEALQLHLPAPSR